MRYLGRLHGVGVLTCGDETFPCAEYDLDGFLVKPGHVMGSGEIRATPQTLKAVFSRRGLQLQTAEGRVLDLRFSDKRMRSASDVASVEIVGELPLASDWMSSAAVGHADLAVDLPAA